VEFILFYVRNQRDAVLSSLFAKSLYMFRVSFVHIIRST